jgi:hypothetical protein
MQWAQKSPFQLDSKTGGERFSLALAGFITRPQAEVKSAQQPSD